MMYNTESHSPKSEDELLELLDAELANRGPVAIIGGHYMLFYDAEQEVLKPVIAQELASEGQREFAKQFAGDFPMKSLKFSVALIRKIRHREIEGKIVFLVNDHKFQSSNFQPDVAPGLNGRAGILRKAYYNANEIPKCYLQVLEESGLNVEQAVYRHDNQQRSSADMLPKKSWFFSEQKLRNRFDDHTKEELLIGGKVRQESRNGRVKLYYESPFSAENVCLANNGSCDCSAEVIELMTNLFGKGFRQVIFFVPNECATPVENGVMAALNISESDSKILTISNVGGMGERPDPGRRFFVNVHENRP